MYEVKLKIPGNGRSQTANHIIIFGGGMDIFWNHKVFLNLLNINI